MQSHFGMIKPIYTAYLRSGSIEKFVYACYSVNKFVLVTKNYN